jgi:hypothetical protein
MGFDFTQGQETIAQLNDDRPAQRQASAHEDLRPWHQTHLGQALGQGGLALKAKDLVTIRLRGSF